MVFLLNASVRYGLSSEGSLSSVETTLVGVDLICSTFSALAAVLEDGTWVWRSDSLDVGSSTARTALVGVIPHSLHMQQSWRTGLW